MKRASSADLTSDMAFLLYIVGGRELGKASTGTALMTEIRLSENSYCWVNPKVAVVVMGAGLRATVKAVESPPDPTTTRTARPVATPGVIEQKSAEGGVAKCSP